MEIRVDGLDAVQRALLRVSSSMRHGLAAGINRTARAIEQHELVEMERVLDRPTPFTLSAIKISAAKPKIDPYAVVYVQPLQAKYLRVTIEGARLPVVLTPINIKLNAYGNIVGKRGANPLERIAGRGKRRFVGEVNGRYGVWERGAGRDSRKLKLLVELMRNQERKPRFDFYGVARRVANQRLRRDVADALRGAIA